MQLATQEEKPKEPEPPKELEEDAAPLKGAKASGQVFTYPLASLVPERSASFTMVAC